MKKALKIISIVFFVVLIFAGCQKKASFGEDDLIFELSGFKIHLNDDIANIIGKLGQPDDYSEAQSCYYAGLDKIYTYRGITFYTYPSASGSDKITEIALTGDTYSTIKGVKIGMKPDEIKKIYGAEYEEIGIMMRYSISDDLYMDLAVQNGKVSRISYVLIP